MPVRPDEEQPLPFGFLPPGEDRTPHDPGQDEAGEGSARPVLSWKGYDLLPFQVRSVEAIRAGKNVLVAAPTGSGKTLVAEYAMLDAVRQGKRCIYTSPIKALSNQKFRDFRDDPEVDVGLMTGDVTIRPQAQVLIMTTEILRNSIFENPRLLSDVAFVVFDEIHYMDDRERGTVWEESLIFLPAPIRLICLSATVSNVDELGAWLDEIREQPMEVVRESRRAVPLSCWCWSERDGAFDPDRLKAVRARTARSRGSGPRRRRGRGGRGGRGGRPGDGAPPDPRALFDDLAERSMLPALVFSFSRKQCEQLASNNQHRQLLTGEETERMRALQRELVQLFKLDERVLRGEVFSMALNGVGYHHAGMLPVFKEVVERMFTAGLLKMLFTTETFALGINMPARSVVFNSLRKFDGISNDWLRTRDFMQMAGRAGRQGIDDEGFVYCVLGSREILEAPLERIFGGRPEAVLSRFRLSYATILHLVDRVGRANLTSAWERSFSCFQSSARNERSREHQQRRQRRLLDRHLQLLDELGYLEGDALTPRGRVARILNGYEVQLTDLLFTGALENLPAQALSVIFVGMIHEERRRFERPWVPERMFGDLRKRISGAVGALAGLEARLGIEPGMKRPDWGLTPAVLAWHEGAGVEDLEELSEASSGDVCRVFRMSIQLMRNVKRALGSEWDLAGTLGQAILAMNRDEIDARRQLELG